MGDAAVDPWIPPSPDRGDREPRPPVSYPRPVFVVTLTYLADLDAIDEALADHAAWLDEQYRDGVFFVSGRQVPRRGGVILAANLDRQDLEARLALDPFRRRGLASYTVTEFVPTRVAPGVALAGEAGAWLVP